MQTLQGSIPLSRASVAERQLTNKYANIYRRGDQLTSILYLVWRLFCQHYIGFCWKFTDSHNLLAAEYYYHHHRTGIRFVNLFEAKLRFSPCRKVCFKLQQPQTVCALMITNRYYFCTIQPAKALRHSGVAGPLAAQRGGQICHPFVLGFCNWRAVPNVIADDRYTLAVTLCFSCPPILHTPAVNMQMSHIKHDAGRQSWAGLLNSYLHCCTTVPVCTRCCHSMS